MSKETEQKIERPYTKLVRGVALASVTWTVGSACLLAAVGDIHGWESTHTFNVSMIMIIGNLASLACALVVAACQRYELRRAAARQGQGRGAEGDA